MRISHLGFEIVPSPEGAYVGGLVKHVVTIANAQVEDGHDISIFTSDIASSLRERQRMSYGHVHSIRTAGPYGSIRFASSFLLGAGAKLTLIHQEQPFDLIHVHSAYSSLGVIAKLLRSVNAPKIFSLYSPNVGWLSSHSCRTHPTWGERLLAKRCLEGFDATIVPSENLRLYLEKLDICKEKLAKIPPALDPAWFGSLPSREEARQALGIPLDRAVVLYVGNYSRWKGIERLLHAMSDILGDFPDTLLLTAWGEPYQWRGSRKEHILTLIDQLNLWPSVRQVGIVTEMTLLYRSADMLVLPLECTCKVLDYPLSILEAMACATPVISTEVGGVPELLGDGGRGLLVAPESVPDLVDAMKALLIDPGMAQDLGRRGSRWVRKHFDPETSRRIWWALYSGLGLASRAS